MKNNFICFADMDGTYIYNTDIVKTIQQPNDAANNLFMEMDGGVIQTYNYKSFEDAREALNQIWNQIRSN